MYLSPIQHWPKHPRPQARAALEEARAAGWSFRPSAGHTFGRLRCLPPERDPESEACKVPLYSTSGSADGSDTARVIRDAVRKCPHDRGPQAENEPSPEVAARLAAGQLAQIQALVEAMESLLAKEEALRDANNVIEGALRRLADDAGAETNSLEQQATEFERLASIEDGRALAAAYRAGAGRTWPPVEGARELLSLARTSLAAANGLVAAAAGSVDERRLAAERERLQEKLDRLSAVLGS